MGGQFTKDLREVTKQDFLLVGGKGANLGEMIKAGLPVPEGFVVLTDGYKKFLEENNLEDKIQHLIQELDSKDIEKLEKISKEIKGLFEKFEIPKVVATEIEKAYEALSDTEVAVAIRSSSTAEDLPGISFAGQYDTYLNVKGKAEIHKHIKKCWASLWNSRGISYRIEQNLNYAQIGHGVVVQKLIDSEKSGILFTANPVNGRRDQIMINSSWGLGEAIVGGEVTPDQWVIQKETGKIIEEIIPQKEVMATRIQKGIKLTKVPESMQKAVTLTKEGLKELLDLAIKVENYFGSPQDIEWAFAEDKFYLVQSRPITSLYPMPLERNNKKGLRVYINVNNYSQAMKEPFTPMGEDIIRTMIEGMVHKLGKKKYQGDRLWWYQVIGGRIFIDITDFMRTEKSWDKFKKKDTTDKDPITTKALLQLVERNRDEIINPKEAVNFAALMNMRLLKFLGDAAIKYCYGIFSPTKARRKAVALGDNTIEKLKEARKSLTTIEDKLRFFEENGSDLFIKGFGIVFYVAVSSTYIEKARSIMEQYLEDTSDLNYVEKSVPYSATTEMGMEILKLAKYYDEKGRRPSVEDEKIVQFLRHYGHRASIDLDVGVPVWKENSQYVLDLINSYIDNKNYQEAMNRFYQGKVEAEEAIQRIKSQLEAKGQNRRAKKVEKLLKDFREMFGIREQSKFFVRQFLTIFREILLEIGEELEKEGILKDKMDVFYVTRENIRSGKDLKDIVLQNKKEYNRNLKRIAPRLLTSTGESIYSAMVEAGEKSLLGIPVSPGVYEGKVKILKTPEEGMQLSQGDILVTTGTNPSWTPLFLKIGALIMETGGPISHGSVVAREYGVPAVAGVVRATELLKDGQIVRINGETGSVEILRKSR